MRLWRDGCFLVQVEPHFKVVSWCCWFCSTSLQLMWFSSALAVGAAHHHFAASVPTRTIFRGLFPFEATVIFIVPRCSCRAAFLVSWDTHEC